MYRLILALLTIMTLISIIGCDNQPAQIPAGTYAQRSVTQVTEATLISSGGYASIPDLEIPPEGGDVHLVPAVAVYADHRSSTQWYSLESYAFRVSNGSIWIDTSAGNSNYYRIVVVK